MTLPLFGVTESMGKLRFFAQPPSGRKWKGPPPQRIGRDFFRVITSTSKSFHKDLMFPTASNLFILLMEEILHHLKCIKPWKKLGYLHILTISTGAGFLNHQQYFCFCSLAFLVVLFSMANSKSRKQGVDLDDLEVCLRCLKIEFRLIYKMARPNRIPVGL